MERRIHSAFARVFGPGAFWPKWVLTHARCDRCRQIRHAMYLEWRNPEGWVCSPTCN
jgi:hypothetical protein